MGLWILIVALALPARCATITTILGQPTDRSITIHTRANAALETYVEYGVEPGVYIAQTKPASSRPDPNASAFSLGQTVLDGLTAGTRYYYRIQSRPAGSKDEFTPAEENIFQTQRLPGDSFVFCVQGDSHPEREKTMFHPALYTQTLQAAAAEQPDFYITSGDDFSVDTLQPPYTAANIAGRYTLQLPYLHNVARSAALFLTNGNHEEASLSNYNLPADRNNTHMVATWAQNARNLYYPMPAPGDPVTGPFYSGNKTPIANIGLLRNYYAWQWGDALFVVIDPYWSSPAQVDTGIGGQGSSTPKTNDRWAITHGDEQYLWLKKTLEESTAKWKFVFAHHVLGTGRGGIGVARQFEWGGNNNNGSWGFTTNRPTWPMPIHQLMAAHNVTIFFQAHDHLFAREQLDGVIYQSLPNPADNTYTAFNADAYPDGDVFPNAGYVKVSVTADGVKVEYIRQFLPEDENPPDQVSGMVQYSYLIGSSLE